MEPAKKTRPTTGDEHSKQSDTGILRLVERREHSLLSLIELSHELTLSLDFYGTADLALLNLMGQMGTPEAALWIIPPDTGKGPILLRSHGIRKQWARAVGTACGPRITGLALGPDMPMLVPDLADTLGPAATRLSEECGIALFAPIHARAQLFGFIALGNRGDGEPYGDVDLQVLYASLGMLGVALENNGLYNRLLEKHRQLSEANENLTELDRLKSEFLRNINHELRTPLTVIIAYLSFLMDQESEDGQRREFLKTIYDESLNLKGLLEKLLDFSDVTGDNLAIELETGDLEDVVRRFHRERLPGVAESLREFSLRLEGNTPLARFDPRRVRQILDVLVDNAVKFTPEGSSLALRLGTETFEEQKWVRIELEDNGPGIPEERLSHIFEPFRQGDGSSTREVGGMGMGLSYAKRLAERMGGRLEVRSKPGSGTTCSLSFPTT